MALRTAAGRAYRSSIAARLLLGIHDPWPAGIYPVSVVRAVGPERLRRFFVQVGDSFQVNKELRGLIVFSAHDLLVDPPCHRMDIVSCRNLLIYLQPAAQRRLASSFAFSLRDGGHLFLGRSENLIDEQGLLQETWSKGRLFRRNAGVRPPAVDFHLAGRPGASDRADGWLHDVSQSSPHWVIQFSLSRREKRT